MEMLLVKINPHLQDLPTIDYRNLEEFQGDMKELTQDNYKKLRNSLKSQGLLSPFVLWLNPSDEKQYLIDGHQRKRLFVMEKVEPFMVPYFLVPGDTIEEAKKNLLSISSQYGTTTEKGFESFTFDIPKKWVQDTINIDALSKSFKIDFEPPKVHKAKNVELKGFRQTHVLISFPSEKLIEIQDALKEITDKDFVEYEQGSN